MCDPHGGGYRGFEHKVYCLKVYPVLSGPPLKLSFLCKYWDLNELCNIRRVKYTHNSMDVSAEEIPNYSFVGIMLTLSGQKLVGCRVAL